MKQIACEIHGRTGVGIAMVMVDGGGRAIHTVVTIDGGRQAAPTTRATHAVVTADGGGTANYQQGWEEPA